jgi:hypothetical protein
MLRHAQHIAFKSYIGSAGQPLIANFSQDCRDETQAGSRVGKDRNIASSAPDFAMQAFQDIGGAQLFAKGCGKGKDGEALRDIGGHPLLDKLNS